MKGLFIALFLIISSLVSAKTFYVSPTGTDGAYPTRGTFANPWRTWQYAFSNTTPSDTCYFRGGTYTDMYNASYGVRLNTESRNGTHSHPTCYFAYPADWAAGNYPVLDCQSLTGQYRSAIEIAQASHLYIKGLTFKNITQASYKTQVRGFHIHNNYVGVEDNPNDIRVENCVVHNASGVGFCVTSCDTVSFINCDAYNICDSLSTLTDYDPGGWGTGFGMYSLPYDVNSYIYLYGCRAWNCSDQGYASDVKGYIEWDHCWGIHNGFFNLPGDPQFGGSGWKNGVEEVNIKNTAILQMYMHNCLAVDNEMQGFNTNDGDGSDPEFRGHFYNNFSYRNGKLHPNGERWGAGYVDFARNPSDTVGLWDHLYINNLSYNNWGNAPSAYKNYPGDVLQAGSYNVSRSFSNYWDVNGTTVTDADFVSLDTTGLCGPRQADGSLPDTDFGKLAPTSELIDAGIYVGLGYTGDRPDIGWVESFSRSASIPVYATSSIETTTPSVVQMVYDLSLANIVPSVSAFSVQVNSSARTVRSVSVSGTKVSLTLSNAVAAADVITVAYTAPSTNPLQTPAGGKAASITAQPVTNSVSPQTNPIYVSSAVENASPLIIEITYNMSLANIVPVTSSFLIQVNSAARSVNSVSISGTKVLLTLSSPVENGNSITVAYTVPSSNPIQTTTGGKATSFSAQPVANRVSPPTIPVYVSSAVENASPSVIEITYNISLANIVPVASSFSVQVNSATRTVNSVSISGTKVVLTLSSPVDNGNIVTIAYTAPSSNQIQTASGGKAASFSAQPITNRVSPPASPDYVSSSVENATPSVIEINYNLTLAGIVPTAAAFSVIVNSSSRGISTVSVSETKVLLTLAAPVVSGDVVTVAYTKPSTNALQTSLGGQAASISPQAVANHVNAVNPPSVANTPPIIRVNYISSTQAGFVSVMNASGSYDSDKDKLTFVWKAPDNISVSSTTSPIIEFLAPIVDVPHTYDFTLTVSDGKNFQSKIVPVEVVPYQPGLDMAEIKSVEASGFQSPYIPYNAVDGNIGTMWAANGTDQWLIIELKESFSVLHIKVAFLPSQKKVSYFDILASSDKENWELILTKSMSCGFSGDLQVFDFPSSKTVTEFKYVKLIGQGNSVDTWNQISEFRIFGYRHKNSHDYEAQLVKIYPNPAHELVNILIDDQTFNPDFIKILNLFGKVLYQDKVDPGVRQLQVPINFKQGVYLVEMGKGNLIMFTQKLIVNY